MKSIESIEAKSIEPMKSIESIEAKSVEPMKSIESIEAKSIEPMKSIESIEAKPIEPMKSIESIEAKPLVESTAVEREGTWPHEMAAASKGAPTKAATSKGRSTKAAASKGGSTKAATAKVPPAKTATTKAAVNGRRAQSRGGRHNRRGGQSNHYVAHHDAPPFVRRRTPAFKYETRQFPPGCSVRHCRSAGEQPGAMKAIGGWIPMRTKKLSGTACRRVSVVVVDVRVQ
jgi:hypothetical protein